jgi:hypothetical protein
LESRRLDLFLSPHGKNSADCQEEEKVLQMVAAVIVEEVDLFFFKCLGELEGKDI